MKYNCKRVVWIKQQQIALKGLIRIIDLVNNHTQRRLKNLGSTHMDIHLTILLFNIFYIITWIIILK